MSVCVSVCVKDKGGEWVGGQKPKEPLGWQRGRGGGGVMAIGEYHCPGNHRLLMPRGEGGGAGVWPTRASKGAGMGRR